MPSAERGFLNDWVVYWAKYNKDAHGRVTLSSPIELKVQWNVADRIVTDAKGKPISIVVDLVAGQATPVGGIMWKGRLRDLSGTTEAPDSDLMEIVMYSPSDDIKGRRTRHEASLARFNDRLPSVVD